MEWTSFDTWIVVAGALASLSCALVGSFLVLRKQSMMGDAISHAVLPGLAIAFLLTNSRGSTAMFVGAAIAGILTALLTNVISRWGKVEEGAAMGVVFTFLFALGLVLIVQAADAVDLDPGCVLYGAIEYVPLSTVRFAGLEFPEALIQLSIMLILNALFVVLFFKELRISSFDPGLANTLGINANLMNNLLMVFVAGTVVACFEIVGSILVIAMLIVPPATAYLLFDKMSRMIVASLVIAVLVALFGHIAAITVPLLFGFDSTSTAGSMAVMAGVFFTLAMLFSPQQGVVSKFIRQASLSIRIIREDILGMVFRLEEKNLPCTRPLLTDMLKEALHRQPIFNRLAIMGLTGGGQLQVEDGIYRLTGQGREQASNVVRSHRLWETYLSQIVSVNDKELHHEAHRLEHVLDDDFVKRLDAELQHPGQDPHGKDIPQESIEHEQ